MATCRTLQRRICPARGIGVRCGASLRSTAMRSRACAANRGMLNGAFVPWPERLARPGRVTRVGALSSEACSGEAARLRRQRPTPSGRRCSRSWPCAPKRCARSWGWPVPAPTTTPRPPTSTAATPSASRSRCPATSSGTCASSAATPTARATCAACWSSRPTSSRPCAGRRNAFRHRLRPSRSPPRPSDGGDRRRWAVVLLLLLLLVGGGAAWWFLGGPGAVATNPTPTPEPSADRRASEPSESAIESGSIAPSATPDPTPEPGRRVHRVRGDRGPGHEPASCSASMAQGRWSIRAACFFDAGQPGARSIGSKPTTACCTGA